MYNAKAPQIGNPNVQTVHELAIWGADKIRRYLAISRSKFSRQRTDIA